MKKFKASVVLLMICCFLMTMVGCGNKELDGEWVWVKSVYVNDEGKTVESDPKEIGIQETYVIKGSKVHYIYNTKSMAAPLESDLKLKKVSDNTYNFVLAGNVIVSNAVFEGDTFYYFTSDDGISKAVFSRGVVATDAPADEAPADDAAADGAATDTAADGAADTAVDAAVEETTAE